MTAYTPGRAARPVATSTKPTGTVNKRAITHLAAHFGGGMILDTPIVVAGTGSRHLGKGRFAGPHLALAMAALIHAAGDRKDVLLRVGDAGGGDRLMIAAARRLGWLQPKIFEARWDAWCPDCHPLGSNPGHRRRHKTGTGTYCPDAGPNRNTAIVAAEPQSHRGIALLQAGLKNSGTLDCATKMARAGIPVTCWCDECGPLLPLTEPCRQHSTRAVIARWHAETLGSRAVA